MATVDENKAYWGSRYDWPESGDEWSIGWGGPVMQWHGTIFPRINSFLPCENILEIACGHGRWTQFLKDLCSQLTVVDLSEQCIDACKERFSESKNITYHVNDGQSLAMIPDNSVDFVFSFDSLVHADESVISSYLSEISRILTKKGSAFIHHSNLGEYQLQLEEIKKNEKRLHWRDPGVDAKKVASMALEYGLCCSSQEIILWGTEHALIDCFSMIVKCESPDEVENKILRNTNFMNEARNLLQLSKLYGPIRSS